MRTETAPGAGLVIRAARTLAGMRQADLGRTVGYSASQISRIESGRAGLDLETAARLAAVLDLSVEELGLAARPRETVPARACRTRVARTPNQESDPVRRRELLAGALGVGAALAVPGGAAAREPADHLERLLYQSRTGTPVALPALEEQLATARRTFRAAEYDNLAAQLPDLVKAAEATRTAATGPQHERAAAATAHAYILASRLAIKQHKHLAWATADRALTAAQDAGRPTVIGEAARVLAITMRRGGSPGAAVDLLQHTAVGLEADRAAAEAGALAVYGSLLLTAAYTAAQSGHAATATGLAAEAESAARRLRGPEPDLYTAGEHTLDHCTAYRISIHHVLGQDAQAVAYARQLPADRLPSAERRGRYYTDVARAWQRLDKPERAFRALRAAEREAPHEVSRPSMRALTAELLYQPGDIPGLNAFARRTGALNA
ncbi:helix-turn-helix transcriptional regulator [Streptomyces sp. STCH 565 A]|uniref:helix-turn-helix transcriptional regulator n=1 Tax=Streptomyces sp. STCH 565 A TaxID=2950532 RepID=UPI002075950F|nr:helix-turn-helix transcriptional regulator [Streptomyces sp. STCH 565 A]MCM8555414.1 helix-turn-helix domain-containing protein [Streptomyces sp. STCH 565 A]